MKARKVKGLDLERPVAENAEKILSLRLDELYSFAPAAVDPSQPQALHDMRIAAKRLRYILELTQPCFGEMGEHGATTAKGLQSLLGEIHDCDEMLPTVLEQIERLRAEDAAVVRDSAGLHAEDVDVAAVKTAPNRTSYRGLEALAAYLRARRDVLYGRFLEEWARLSDERFREELEAGLAEAAAEARDGGDGEARANGARTNGRGAGATGAGAATGG